MPALKRKELRESARADVFESPTRVFQKRTPCGRLKARFSLATPPFLVTLADLSRATHRRLGTMCFKMWGYSSVGRALRSQ